MTPKQLQRVAEREFEIIEQAYQASHAVAHALRQIRERPISEFSSGWVDVLDKMQLHHEVMVRLEKEHEKFTDLVFG